MWPPLTIGVVFTEKHHFITYTLPKSKTSPNSHTKSHVYFYYFVSIYLLLENLPDLHIFSLDLDETSIFP